jgi:hypothetical protein
MNFVHYIEHTATGNKYGVLETEPKRSQDHRRFEVRKYQRVGAMTTYVVTYQSGRGRQCSCSPSGLQGKCKHLKLVRNAKYPMII